MDVTYKYRTANIVVVAFDEMTDHPAWNASVYFNGICYHIAQSYVGENNALNKAKNFVDKYMEDGEGL